MKHGILELGTGVRFLALRESTRAHLLLFQQYERVKKANDECVALLNGLEGEPISVQSCERILQMISNEPGSEE